MKLIRITAAGAFAAFALAGLAGTALADPPESLPAATTTTAAPVTTTTLAAVTGGSEQNSTSETIEAGALSAVLGSDVMFPDLVESHSAQAPTSPNSLLVDDLTGMQGGWTVSIQASDLTSATNCLPDNNVGLASTGSPLATFRAAAGITEGAAGPIGGDTTCTAGDVATGAANAIQLLSAGSGDGVGSYTLPFTLSLLVPADTVPGSYSGTLTITSLEN